MSETTCEWNDCTEKAVCAVAFGGFICEACKEHGSAGYAMMRRLDPLLDALTTAAERGEL